MTINQLRDKLLDLKCEKAEIVAEIAALNERLARKLPPADFENAKAEKAELSADQAEVDTEIAKVNTAIAKISEAERQRDHRLHNIRLLAAAFIQSGFGPSKCITMAVDFENEIQALIPLPSVELATEAEDAA